MSGRPVRSVRPVHSVHSVHSVHIVYHKGDDHIIDADRCAMLAHYRDTHEDCPETSLGIRIETF